MNREKKVRLICWIICEVLAVGTVICLLSGGMNEGLLLALATPLILLLPSLAEKLFFPTGKIFCGNRLIFRQVKFVYNIIPLKCCFKVLCEQILLLRVSI